MQYIKTTIITQNKAINNFLQVAKLYNYLLSIRYTTLQNYLTLRLSFQT
jgi:hypothetical protein